MSHFRRVLVDTAAGQGMPTPSQSSTTSGADTSGSTWAKIPRRGGANDAGVVASLYRYSNENETKSFGAEGVRDALNTTLGDLILTVEQHGGDVLRIAGDALIVLFHQVGQGGNIPAATSVGRSATCGILASWQSEMASRWLYLVTWGFYCRTP